MLRSTRLVAQQLRCARNHSFIGSETRSEHVRFACARARQDIEKTAVSASKIEFWRSKTTPERARNAPRSLRRAPEPPERAQANRKFQRRALAEAIWASSGAVLAFRSAVRAPCCRELRAVLSEYSKGYIYIYIYIYILGGGCLFATSEDRYE